MARCKARLSVASCDAKVLAQAVGVDNLPNMSTHYENGFVITEVETDGIGSLLTTLDDILVNLKVANDVVCGRNADEDQRD
jgi:hypothetical protein